MTKYLKVISFTLFISFLIMSIAILFSETEFKWRFLLLFGLYTFLIFVFQCMWEETEELMKDG